MATGDFDNDGWVDLYLTRFGRNRMLRNLGDGTFADVSAATGTDEPSWGVPASFLDIDRDGWLGSVRGQLPELHAGHAYAVLPPVRARPTTARRR